MREAKKALTEQCHVNRRKMKNIMIWVKGPGSSYKHNSADVTTDMNMS